MPTWWSSPFLSPEPLDAVRDDLRELAKGRTVALGGLGASAEGAAEIGAVHLASGPDRGGGTYIALFRRPTGSLKNLDKP